MYCGLKKAVTTRLAVLAGLFRIVYSIYQFFENFVNKLCAHDIQNQTTNLQIVFLEVEISIVIVI